MPVGPGRATTATPAAAVARVRAWSLWGHPPATVAYLLAVDALALVVTGMAVVSDPVDGHDVGVAGLLVAGALVHTELTVRIERLRSLAPSEQRPYVDLRAMWSFAAVLLLPLSLALGVALVTFGHWMLRVRPTGRAHRWVLSKASVLLALAAASAVLGLLAAGHPFDLRGPAALMVVTGAVVVRWVVNHGLVVGADRMCAAAESWWARFLDPTESFVGLGGLALGVLLAALGQASPWMLPILLGPLVVLHRGITLQNLVLDAHVDTKTGVATADAWRAVACRRLRRARRRGHPLAVLMVDLDHFKAVNDHWGHLAGDEVLRAFGELLRDELREVEGAHAGRFGGEEFVVLLEGARRPDAMTVAERVRRRVAVLEVPTGPAGAAVGDLSVSVGVATYRHGPCALADLLLAADHALYAAKDRGRNRVRSADGGCVVPAPFPPAGLGPRAEPDPDGPRLERTASDPPPAPARPHSMS